MVLLERSKTVRLRYLTADGEISLAAEGAFAELIQHEMDHLDGILAIDRALGRDAFCTRDEWLRRFSPSKTQSS